MGAACKPKPKQDSSGNQATSQSTASANAAMAASMDGSQAAYDNLNPFEKAAQDLKMDLGIMEKDSQYYANLDDRQQRSQDALANLKKKKDKPKIDDKPVEEVDDTEDTSEDTTDNTTVLNETTDAALDNVQNISTSTFQNTDNISNYFDNTATSVNTAAAQEQNKASALTTSVGEAEDEAIEYMTTGTGSNIFNPGGAQGLLSDDDDEDDPFNRKKTLIGA